MYIHRNRIDTNKIMNGLFTEATSDMDTHIIRDELYPIIEKVLLTPQGDRLFKNAVGKYINKNTEKLHTPGPQYLIVFGDNDKEEFYKIFGLTQKEIAKYIGKVLTTLKGNGGKPADFKLLSNNHIFWVFYCCIRFYTLHNDIKGLNTALVIYALSVYPSIFHKYFKYEVSNPACMQYTIDNLTNKFIIKQKGHIYGALSYSIGQSYKFLKDSFKDSPDREIIRFIQRIRNDQNSMIKKICDQYQKNFAKGLQVDTSKDSYDDKLVDDNYNNTSIVELLSRKIIAPLINNGVDLKRAELCAKLAQISISDTRYYLTKIISTKESANIQKMVESILFIYLYEDKKSEIDINTPGFLIWASDAFRRTNTSNENIVAIKSLLDKWAESSGVHAKFKREASRVNYKKAIFFYFILSIQSYK